MSVRSRRSSKALNRAFDPAILRRARALADAYQIVIRFEDGEYFGRGVEFPLVMNDGATPDECVRKTRDAIVTAIAYLLENGKAPPPPASESKRTEQVNIRLTSEERLLLEEAARAKGFRGISDFVRSASLADARG